MRREILLYKRGKHITCCCPGHDKWPGESYNGRISKHARSRDKQKEHQLARTSARRKLAGSLL